MSYVTDINGKQFKKQKKNKFYLVLLDPFGGAIFIFEWSFWACLVRSLTLNLFGPFGPVWWCDL
jgi:hypothetical protein